MAKRALPLGKVYTLLEPGPVVLLGTVFPLVIEALQDRRLSVGRPFFDRMTTPLGLSLLTLMAIAPGTEPYPPLRAVPPMITLAMVQSS